MQMLSFVDAFRAYFFAVHRFPPFKGAPLLNSFKNKLHSSYAQTAASPAASLSALQYSKFQLKSICVFIIIDYHRIVKPNNDIMYKNIQLSCFDFVLIAA